MWNVNSRKRSEGSCFIWGSGGEVVFAENCFDIRNRSQSFVIVRNRPQPSATVCVSGISSPQWRVHQEWSWQRMKLIRCRRSYIGVCRRGIYVSHLCRRNYIGVCRGAVCVSDLCRRGYFGVCRGGICGSDLCRRSYIGVCLVFAEEVSVWVICVAAVILACAEEVSVWVICVPEGCRTSMSWQNVL